MFFYQGHWEGHRVQNTADVNVTGPFTLGGREHELVAGFMTSHSRQTGATYGTPTDSDGLVPGNIFDWNRPHRRNRTSRKTASTNAPRARTAPTWPRACVRPTTCRSSSAAVSAPSSTTRITPTTRAPAWPTPTPATRNTASSRLTPVWSMTWTTPTRCTPATPASTSHKSTRTPTARPWTRLKATATRPV